jgi:hypothetical protein
LDRRTDASVVDGNINALDRQRRISQLGDTEWTNDVQLAVDPSGPREQPLAAREGEITHLYRGMSEEEFQTSKARGFIQSDQRGVIEEGWEGTNAATNPSTAHVYLPRTGTGRIVKMSVLNPHQWFASGNDSYARTREPIPWESVVAHTEEFAHPDSEANKRKTFRARAIAEEDH